MKTRAFLIGLGMGLLIGLANGVDAATITVKSPVSVKAAAMVTLGDMASITGASKAEVDQLARIQITRAPLAGYEKTVDLQYVKLRMRSAIGDVSKLKFSVPQSFVLAARCSTVKGDDIASAAKEFILAQMPSDGRRYEAEVSRAVSDVTAPEGRVDFKVDSPTSRYSAGPRTVGVGVMIDGKPFTRVTVFMDVKVYAEVLIASANIGQKAAVDESNTSWETREVTRIPSPVMKSFDTSAAVAARSIAAGTVITTDMLKARPAVEGGSTVTILVRSGSVRLSAEGTAIQAGAVGESIPVKGPFASGELRATVLEPGLVEIRI